MMTEVPNPADVMIVLGRVDSKGNLTKDAHERIRYAAQLYKRQLAPVIVSPAKRSYRLSETPIMTEAATIRAGLVARGVPADAILLEEKSCDTLGAAYFTKVDYILKNNWKRILVVTSEDHLERTKYVFHKVFGKAYDIQYVYGNRVLQDEEFVQSLEREKKSLQLMDTTWVGPVTPGEHSMVASIFKLHPGYNPRAKVSPEEIEKRVQAQVARA